jgi:uncharacterized protein YndB with AHSA1/START domain
MKWFKRILIGVIALLLLFAAVGLALPSHFRVERSVTIAAPADKVYALIAAPCEWKRWTVWNQRDPDMHIQYAGPEAGAGARWSWRSPTEGNGDMEFTEAQPGRQLAYRLSFPDFGMQSKGLLRIEPQSSGVRVSWSNEGEMGASPVNRWFGLFMDRLVGPDFEAGLANLKRLAEQS